MVLERFVLRCRSAGIINDEVVRKVRASTMNLINQDVSFQSFKPSLISKRNFFFQMPSRGRKRFVSEGDGGLVKETSWSAQYSVVVELLIAIELEFAVFIFIHISGDGRVGEEKVLTLRQQLSFRGQSLCLPVIQGAVKELFSKVVSLLHPVCT